jgi:proteasome lid subunit RPN8/RPN11
MKILLKQADFDRMAEHGRRNLPNEACGLLAGSMDLENGIKTVEKVFLLSNPDQSPEHFSIDPREQLQTIQEIRRLGLTLLGNFHTHPSTPARPSQEDQRLAHDPNASYLILSLMGEEAVVKSFHMERTDRILSPGGERAGEENGSEGGNRIAVSAEEITIL